MRLPNVSECELERALPDCPVFVHPTGTRFLLDAE